MMNNKHEQKRAKFLAKQEQQKKWDGQREAANNLPESELLEKARDGKQLNRFESMRLYAIHDRRVSLDAANHQLHRSLLSKISTLEKEMRDQQFFSAKIENVATTHNDKLGASVSSVLWGRAANLVAALLPKKDEPTF